MRSKRKTQSRFGMLLAIGFVAGCGAERDMSVSADRRGLQEFAAIYRGFIQKHQRSPKNLKELRVKGQGYPNAMEKLKSANLIIRWGLPKSPERDAADVVLAYEKDAGQGSVLVLMQDGWTIKKMSAEEFEAISE